MRKILLWLVMVVLMVTLLLGGTGWFLYSATGANTLPQEPVTFGEITLEPNGYDWQVPVLGGIVQKQFDSPTNLTVQNLGNFVEPPTLTLPAWATGAELDITGPDGNTWYGTLATCNTYAYTQNGNYELVLRVRRQEDDPPADPQGWYAYRATYTVSIAPDIALSSTRAQQGSVVALELTGLLDGEPSVETDLGRVWFRKTANGYMGYIPVTYNAESGDHELKLSCGSVNQTLSLTVTQAATTIVNLPATEEAGGAQEFQNAIWPLYNAGQGEKLWQGPFAPPSTGGIAVAYGSVRMVDGNRSGQATAITYSAEPGSAVTAPQAGKVVYAGYLTLTGNTVVIDHGCGVKSYLFGLGEISAMQGQAVAVGDAVAAMGEGGEVQYELRIGNKSVDPAAAIRGNSGLQYHENAGA